MKFPFVFEKKKIIVKPIIYGLSGIKEFNFILDTGAGTTVITPEVANVLGYRSQITQTETFVTVGGRVNSKILKIKRLKLFEKEVNNFEVTIISLPLQITLIADGLIGIDFLSKFKSLKIDFETNVIEI